MHDKDIHRVIEILETEVKRWKTPSVTKISENRDPFKILISTIISLRTKDEVTLKASQRLFKTAPNPEKLIKLKTEDIEKLIYPAGFYRIKAKNIKKISKILLNNYSGKVPDSIEELIKLPGVGRKTANLVVTLGYGKPGICVDTHVHRILNRLGYVKTKNPEETEKILREKLPEKYWIRINDLLVTYGQNMCTPLSPFCSKCRLYSYCNRVGVKKSR